MRDGKGVVLYPPTMMYNGFHQRPQSLLMEFAKDGWLVIWQNPETKEGETKNAERVAKNFYIYHNQKDVNEDFENGVDVVFAHWARWYDYPLKHKLLLHDCTDYFEYWEKYQKHMTRKADIITCVSQPLKRYFEKKRNRPDAHVISNGVDVDYFQNNGKREPPELQKMKRPILGFIGAVGFWNDVAILKELSQIYTTVVVGHFATVNPNKPQRKPQPQPSKLGIVDRQPWERMPEFFNHIDIGIIPTNNNPTATHAVPLKAWEYMACAKPVIATDNEQLRNDFGDLIRYMPISKNKNDRKRWVQAVRQELKKDNEEKRQQRIQSMEKQSWQTRYQEMLPLIEEKL